VIGIVPSDCRVGVGSESLALSHNFQPNPDPAITWHESNHREVQLGLGLQL
jgi:hypothetical protein